MQRATVVLIFLIGCTFSFPSRTVDQEKRISKDFDKPVGKTNGIIRTRRNLVQFHRMIACETNRTSSSYYDYGCYCGYGGGGEPVDETDKCCQIHDKCYDAVKDAKLCTFSSSIYWRVYSRDGTCTGCADPEGTCKRAICECDGAASRCFKHAKYNEENFDYPQEKCKEVNNMVGFDSDE
ncbi:PREDICTED: basic phospholipase A2 nigroxin B-like [Acropora digitifera]|uniref:basic phospholipase A2 nigroxin B-like n=1 Tax=Acropora digitifera TaxID=70779 RepID=UPI00077B18B1|nr:PREDICTED: basic phospholipase A2 nigroxin B-like [Acropora digitifera]